MTILSHIHRQVQDIHSVVAYARKSPLFDRTKVVVWGTSFGGGQATIVAAQARCCRSSSVLHFRIDIGIFQITNRTQS